MIIGLTGTLSAGKGTVVELLKEKGFRHLSVRAFLTKEIEKRRLPLNRESMVEVANELRAKHSPSYIAEKLYEEAEGNTIIESLRTPEEITALREKGNFILIAVDADPKVRYDRAFSRGSSTDRISFEEFTAQEKKEMTSDDPNKQNLKKCIEMADFVVENNEGFEELNDKIGAILKNHIQKIGKRKDYISWDDYFMALAVLSGMRSKDPNTQVGACIVDEEKKVVGIGYNGFPKGVSDDAFPWAREGPFLETKYPYVCHAELNAILNSFGRNLKGSTLYVQLFPCNECCKAIIQSEIIKVVYLSNKYEGIDSVIASKKMFDSAGVKYEKVIPKDKKIFLDLGVDK